MPSGQSGTDRSEAAAGGSLARVAQSEASDPDGELAAIRRMILSSDLEAVAEAIRRLEGLTPEAARRPEVRELQESARVRLRLLRSRGLP